MSASGPPHCVTRSNKTAKQIYLASKLLPVPATKHLMVVCHMGLSRCMGWGGGGGYESLPVTLIECQMCLRRSFDDFAFSSSNSRTAHECEEVRKNMPI